MRRWQLAGIGQVDEVLACSSAGGGLRLAVVGYEREVTAQAGYRVGLSAGAKVVHVSAGPMSGADLGDLRASRPDLVLLVGGTDGGNAEVLLHNASRLAKARIGAPVVVAGNADAARRGRRAARLDRTQVRRHRQRAPADRGDRPRVRRAPPSGRVFLEHVIGGKGLSQGPEFAEMVQAPTPDAVLDGVEVLAEHLDGDVLVVDIGGRDHRRLLRAATRRARTPGSPRTSSRRCGTRAPSRPTSACAGTPKASSRPPSASTSRCPRT